MNRKSSFGGSRSECDLLGQARLALQECDVVLSENREVPLLTGALSEREPVVEVEWNNQRARFVCQVERSSTPQTLKSAVAQAEFGARRAGLAPLVIVPYLSDAKLQLLAEIGVSGLDACGNAFIRSDRFQFWRSGRPNVVRTPAPHLNPFRGDNSLFSQCFLLQGEFESLSELRAFATRRLKTRTNSDIEELRLGTASKTVQALREELMITKASGRLALLDRPRLVLELRNQFQPPKVTRRIVGKTPHAPSATWDQLRTAEAKDGLRTAVSGVASAHRYGVMSPSAKLILYVDNAGSALRALELREGSAFANCEIRETPKNAPFFDLRPDEKEIPWASPVFTWLELSRGSAREQEAAAALQDRILAGEFD